MLFSVTFNVGMRDDCLCCWALGKEISKEEGDNRLAPSSILCSREIACRLLLLVLEAIKGCLRCYG